MRRQHWSAMPLISTLRFIFSLFSLAVLGLGLWSAWNWYSDEAYWTSDGSFHVVLVDWRIWLGALLLLWSFLGKFVWVPVLAKPDGSDPSDPRVPRGEIIHSSTGADLNVDRSGGGAGPALLFLHGWAMDSSLWSYARRHFGSQHPVVTVDLPGLGRSRARGAITLARLSDDVVSVLEQIEGPVVLVGHSIGGMIIQTIARRRPDLFSAGRVAGIVLINTTYTNPLKTMILPGLMRALQPLLEVMSHLETLLFPISWVCAWQSYLSGSAHMSVRIAHGPNVTRSQLEHTALATTRSNPAVVAKGNIAMFHWDGSGALSDIAVPCLVLGGTQDIVTKPTASRHIAASSRAAQLGIIAQSNHMSVLDRAEIYHEQIDAFLSKLSSASPPAGRSAEDEL